MLYHGLVLLGIYLAVTGISALSGLPNLVSSYDSDLKRLVVPENWWVLALAVSAALAFLSVLPGVLLVKYAGPIAEKFSHGESSESPGFSESGLYVLIFVAMAVFFFVTGIAEFIAGLVQIVPELLDWSEYSMVRFGIGPVLDGTIRISAAIWLYHHSLSVAKPAA